jgi:hypothetical protein
MEAFQTGIKKDKSISENYVYHIHKVSVTESGNVPALLPEPVKDTK